MEGPMIFPQDLSQENLAQVQALINSVTNQSPGDYAEKLQELMKGNFKLPTEEELNRLKNSSGSNSNTIQQQIFGNKYKICMIENGKIRFPDASQEEELIQASLSESMENLHQTKIPTTNTNEKKKPKVNQFSDEQIQTLLENIKRYHARSGTADFSPPQDTKTSETTDNDELPKEAPKVERLDNDIMNKLLDFYRKFNERQLGLASDKHTPRYVQSNEIPESVICDNDIIKEAIKRIRQKRELGEVIQEPTIIEIEDEVEYFKQVEEEERQTKKTSEQIKIDIKAENSETEDELDEEFEDETDDSDYEDVNLQCKDKQNYKDEWIFATNFIEKTLQKKIDEGKRERVPKKKWDRKDIIKLVEMLSKKREQKKVGREWRGRESSRPDRRDDMVYKIDELKGYEYEKKDSLFDRLKRERGGYDGQELRQFVAENSYRFRTSRPVSKDKVYYGGDELLIVYEYITSIFNFSWLWNVYESTIGKWFDTYYRFGANGGIACGDDGEKRWFKWNFDLSPTKWFSRWFPSRWSFASTGKPIYKQVRYEETEYDNLQEQLARENDSNGILKNRKVKHCTDFGQATGKRRIEVDESIEQPPRENIVIDVEQEIYSTPRKARGPIPGQIYISDENGDIYLNLDS